MIQLLESRLLITLVEFTGNTLTVQLTGTESELIIANSGIHTRLRVDGMYVGGPGTLANGSVDSNEIHQMIVIGNNQANTLDLHNVFRTQTRYANLTTVIISGGAGDDSVTGSAFDDLIQGGAGNDSLVGTTGADTLMGEGGEDTLDGGVGIDSLIGGHGQDTVHTIVTGPQADSIDDDLNDIVFAVGLPDYSDPGSSGFLFDPDTEQNLRLLTGDFQAPLPDGITVYGEARDFTWGLTNYSGEWSNPAFNITGDYAFIDARSPGTDLLSSESYSMVINITTGNPEYLFTPALPNFRWSLNPDTPTRFYDVTGDDNAFLKIGDIKTGITKTVNLQGPNGESFGVVQSKAGVMMGSLSDRSGEFLAVLKSSRQSPTQRTIEEVMVLDLAAAEAEDWDRLIVSQYDLAGMSDASDDLYSAPDASFLALGDNRSGDSNSLKDRFVMIKLGQMPNVPGTRRLDEPNGTQGLMWSWPLLNVPSSLYETPSEAPADGVLPFKLAHPTFAYGADQQVYFVGGISLSMVGRPVDTSGGNIVNYSNAASATIGSLLAVNTQTADFHLLTPGVNSNGQYESLVDHVSGTNQVRASGGYIFASYNTLAHRVYSGDYIRVTLGADSIQEHRITRVTRHRSGAYDNSVGQNCSECQFFPNSSPDGSKLLLTSTFGIDVSAIDLLASHPLSANKTFLVDFTLQGAALENSVPGIDSSGAYEVEEGTTQVTTVTGVDDDIHDFRSMSYFLSGADSEYLSIDRATGELRFKVPPEFAMPRDSNRDNVYEFGVQVADRSGAAYTQHFSVLVNDAKPRFGATQIGATLNIDAIRQTNDVVTLEFQYSDGTNHLLAAVRYDQIYDFELNAVETVSLNLGDGHDSLVLLSTILNGVTLRIAGGDGNDRVDTTMAVMCPVLLLGERGADTLIGGAGPDTLIGGIGGDVIDGGAGHDVLVGSVGNDTLSGGSGDYFVSGQSGHDSMSGGPGNDVLIGNGGRDTQSGGEGNDTLLGRSGNDLLFGDSGDDLVSGSRGNDTLSGGSGNDWLLGGGGVDTLNGNADNDTLDGSSGDDHLMGGGGDDFINGRNGNDTIVGNAGEDILIGWRGDDILFGQAGSDTLDAGDGNDQLMGGLDSDLLVGGADDDVLDGGIEQDTLATGGGDDTFVDAGDDLIDEAYVNWYEEGFVAP